MGVGAGLLSPEQRERWNHFHGATALSKAVRAAVRFAPWTLKGLARLSESKLGGRALYYGVFKRLIGEALPYLQHLVSAWCSRLGQPTCKPALCTHSVCMAILPACR